MPPDFSTYYNPLLGVFLRSVPPFPVIFLCTKTRTLYQMTYPHTVPIYRAADMFVLADELSDVCVIKLNTLYTDRTPDSKFHGAIMGPIWGRQDPGGPMLAPWTLLSGCTYCDVGVACKSLGTGSHYLIHAMFLQPPDVMEANLLHWHSR